MRIAIIGAGSVGTNLHHAFELNGVKTELVHARPLTAEPSAVASVPQADVYIYTVADHALRDVVAKVYAPKALHVHTSGTIPISVFGEDKPQAGILYFFQSFSKSHLVEDWHQIPVFIEGRNIDDVAAIYALAQTLSSVIYEATQEEREQLHVAGVFANNFTNLMYRHAADILSKTSIPFSVLLPLIDQTAEKMHAISADEAQTGPAKRHDQAIMAHHMELLDEEKRTVYQLLSQQIMSRY